ncbi:tetratricopeptide repeat protein [Streptomyces sp. NPDC099088]|uniref:tetratricopeptide repeat protein n=1 Tax=Streptomyces sp. NPDC099088 TaxID=3366101 RepID=UPI003803D6ED
MSDVFVGRADEQNRLRVLLHQLDSAGPDEGRVVLVRGQGGVGKSTLLARMREIVAQERPRRGWRRKHVTSVFLDWGEDPLRSAATASADGPEVWRLLAAVEAALGETCGAAAERAFDAFRQQASHLPELVERAKKSMLDDHIAAQPVVGTKEAQALLSNLGALGLTVAGAPVGQKSVESAVSGLFAAGSAARRIRRGGVDPQVFRQVVDAKTALIAAFGMGIRALSRRRPVVIIMDTCELLGSTLLELRQVVARSGPDTVWVLGTRLEEGIQRAEDSIAERLIRGVHHTRLHDMPLPVFDDDSAAAYISARRPDLTEWEVGQAVEFSQGLPLALALVVQALEDGMSIDEVCERPSDDHGLPSDVVQKLALRYLTHTASVEALADDRAKLCALALARHNDPDVLAVLWDVPPSQVRAITDRLTLRHDFMSSHHRVLHDDVRRSLLNLLLRKDERASVREANQRAADFLRERAARAGHRTVDEQLSDEQWLRDIAAFVWHTFWADPRTGTNLMVQLLPWAEPVPDFRNQLIAHAQFFAPTCLAADATLLTSLRTFGSTGHRTFPLQGNPTAHPGRKQVLSAAATAPEGLVATNPPASLYRSLWAAATASGVSTTEVLTLLEAAAHHPLPADSITGRRISELASGHTRGWHAIRDMDDFERRNELRLQEIVVRHSPAVSAAYTDLGDCLTETGQWQEAERAYRNALHNDANEGNAHTGLGRCLARSQRWTDAERSYRDALARNRSDANAHTGLGNCLIVSGQFEDALLSYREATHHDVTQNSAHHGIGRLLWINGDLKNAEKSFRSSLSIEDGTIAGVHLGLLLLHMKRAEEARSTLENAPSGHVQRNLLLAVAVHLTDPALASICVQASLEASEHPADLRRLTSSFTHAHDRALALAAAGRGVEGAAELRAAVSMRTPGLIFEKPRYDLLAAVIGESDREAILQVWREIIAVDAKAAGPWGPP